MLLALRAIADEVTGLLHDVFVEPEPGDVVFNVMWLCTFAFVGYAIAFSLRLVS